MATDYRFAIQCWQDSAGSEDARMDVYIDDTKVVDNVTITATSVDSPQLVTWETSGLADPNIDGSVTINMKVVLKNEYYVDSNTDRNIWINTIGHNPKIDNVSGLTGSVYVTPQSDPKTEVSDWTTIDSYFQELPTAVSGDQIPSDFWSGVSVFHEIPVWGSDGTAGTTITYPLK